MKLHRLLSLTCSMAASLAMTACGGGNSDGPAWAQTLKNSLNSPASATAVTDLLPGEYRGACEAVQGGNLAATLQVLVVAQVGGETLLTQKEELYDYDSCTDDAYLGSLVQPTVKLTLDSEGTDAASGKRFLKVNASNPGGDVQVNKEPNAALTVSKASSDTLTLSFDSSPGLELTRPAKAAASTTKDVYALINGKLYRGDNTSRQPANTGFATALNLSKAFTPYKLFDVKSGTYRGECQAVAIVAGKSREYGVLAKNTFLPAGPDGRPRYTPSVEVYDDTICESLLYIETYPTVSLDTVGNTKVNISDDPAQPYTVDARQVILTYSAGPVEITLDQDAETNGSVSLSGQTVTLLKDKNLTKTYADQTASTTKSLRYLSLTQLYLADEVQETPGTVTTFPMELFQKAPWSLQ